MESTLSLGAFEELSENETMETEGGSCLVPAVIFFAVGVVLIYEPIAQAVDKGNRGVAQSNANSSGEPYTVNQISIVNNIKSGSTYTAYPNR